MQKHTLLRIFELSRILKTTIQVSTDLILISLSFFLSLIIRLNNFDVIFDNNNLLILTILIPLTIIIYFCFGFYRSIIRYVSENFFIIAFLSILLSALIMFIIAYTLEFFLPKSIPILYFNFLFIFTISIRYFLKFMFLSFNFDKRKPVAIYGAGESGRGLLNSLIENLDYKPLFFLDDDKQLTNKKINGLKVLKFENSLKLLKKFNVNLILLALPKISTSKRIAIISKLEQYSFAIKKIPDNTDLINGNTSVTDFSNISINDLFERDEIPLNINLIEKHTFNKTILITGGGGTIGSEICKQILNIRPKIIIYLDNSEFSLYRIDQEIQSYVKNKNLNIRTFPILGSVQDKNLLNSLFNKFKINTVYHTAAYKHVPLVEKNIIEGLKNNVFGTYTLSEISILYNVENFILISSDKAVRPTNYMGANKRLAELICQSYSGQQKNTVFSIVRFGNVIGSSGSVVPLFEKQIKNGGPVTLTHKKITRYFMTIKEAAGLVIQAGAMSKNGDLFILEMGKPVKILDLAKKMIRLYGKNPVILTSRSTKQISKNDIGIMIIGLRQGEKIYEELLLDNNISLTAHPRIIKAREKSILRSELLVLIGKLKKYSEKQDLKNIKLTLEKAPIDFNTTNNYSELN